MCSSATVLFMMLSKSNSKKPMEWFIIKQKLALRLRSYNLKVKVQQFLYILYSGKGETKVI